MALRFQPDGRCTGLVSSLSSFVRFAVGSTTVVATVVVGGTADSAVDLAIARDASLVATRNHGGRLAEPPSLRRCCCAGACAIRCGSKRCGNSVSTAWSRILAPAVGATFGGPCC